MKSPNASNTENNLSGVRAAISLYQPEGDIKKVKNMEEHIEKDKNGDLETWMKAQNGNEAISD